MLRDCVGVLWSEYVMKHENRNVGRDPGHRAHRTSADRQAGYLVCARAQPSISVTQGGIFHEAANKATLRRVSETQCKVVTVALNTMSCIELLLLLH